MCYAVELITHQLQGEVGMHKGITLAAATCFSPFPASLLTLVYMRTFFIYNHPGKISIILETTLTTHYVMPF